MHILAGLTQGITSAGGPTHFSDALNKLILKATNTTHKFMASKFGYKGSVRFRDTAGEGSTGTLTLFMLKVGGALPMVQIRAEKDGLHVFSWVENSESGEDYLNKLIGKVGWMDVRADDFEWSLDFALVSANKWWGSIISPNAKADISSFCGFVIKKYLKSKINSSANLTAGKGGLGVKVHRLMLKGSDLMEKHLNKLVSGRDIDDGDTLLLYGSKLDYKSKELILSYTTPNKVNLKDPNWGGDKISPKDPYATHTAVLKFRLLDDSDMVIIAEIMKGRSVVFSKEVGSTGKICDYSWGAIFNDFKAATLDPNKWYALDKQYQKARKLVEEFRGGMYMLHSFHNRNKDS